MIHLPTLESIGGATMDNQIVKLEPPKVIPNDWDYCVSVKKVRQVIYKWGDITLDLANELWIAREILSAQGARTDLGANASKLTWGGYCKDIGNNKSTVNRWLARWFKRKELPSPSGIIVPPGKYQTSNVLASVCPRVDLCGAFGAGVA